MKCLIFSDSHGNEIYMQRAINLNRDADIIFFLGDGLSDAELLAENDTRHTWIAVRGNCDFRSLFLGRRVDKTEEIIIENKKIVATHGDLYSVKYGLENISNLAFSRSADIILFGHTHKAHEEYVSEPKPHYLFNPGSIKEGEFGILTLNSNTVLFSHGKI